MTDPIYPICPFCGGMSGKHYVGYKQCPIAAPASYLRTAAHGQNWAAMGFPDFTAALLAIADGIEAKQ